MKQRFLFFIALFSLVQVSAFSQSKSNDKKEPVIYSEDEIRSISVSDGVDVILIQGKEDRQSVKLPDESLGLVKVNFSRGNLQLTKKNRFSNERVLVYVEVYALQNITLKGNSFITSKGILDIDNLEVNLDGEARIAIRSKGKLKVNAPSDYQLVQEEKYFAAYSTGK
jgi:putative autotransporter adhesin-like protein